MAGQHAGTVDILKYLQVVILKYLQVVNQTKGSTTYTHSQARDFLTPDSVFKYDIPIHGIEELAEEGSNRQWMVAAWIMTEGIKGQPATAALSTCPGQQPAYTRHGGIAQWACLQVPRASYRKVAR